MPPVNLNAFLGIKVVDLTPPYCPATTAPPANTAVNDVLNFATLEAFPTVGVEGVIYIAENSNLMYRWDGSGYIGLSPASESTGGLVLGETSGTAYRGDRGKIAYDHSQVTAANPHGANIDQILDGITYRLYTQVEKTKLAGISGGATANDTDANLKNRANHTGTQNADTITDGTVNKVYTATEKTKVGHISVTQAVDLDAMEARVNGLDAAIVLKGTWDASAGTFPGGGTAQAGDSYIVSVAGTVNSVAFAVGDRIMAIVDNASTSTFAANWFKADYTDLVSSVDGLTGVVVLPRASTTEALTGTDTSKIVTADALAALWEQGSNIASAGTISIGEGGYFHITGTTTITDIDPATDKAGRKFTLVFDGVLTLTHNGSTLILPSGASIATEAGDTADFISEGSDIVRCTAYHRKSGVALIDTGGGTVESTVIDGSANAVSSNAVFDALALKLDASLVSAAGLALIDDANAAAQRTTMGVDTTANQTDSTNKRFVTDAQEAKIDFITVTQAVDLDAIETRVVSLDAAVVLRGSWDASAGTFPGSGTAQAGDAYIVSVAGTVNSVAFAINDRIIAITDNASTTTFAANWFKEDYTDAVLSVNGMTGAVTGLTTPTSTEAFQNKTINLSDNTLSMTMGQLNAALSDADFGTLSTQSGIFSGVSSGVNTGDQATVVGMSFTKAQLDTAVSDANLVPEARTLTIDGVALDLSTNRSWTTSGGAAAASTTETLTGTDGAKFVSPDTLAALWEQGSNIASAGTISIGEGGYFHVTGTTTITDIDPTTDKAGRKFILVFDGILTLTHHSTTLILPTGANITTAAGDTAEFVSEGSDAVRCVVYSRKSGASLVGSSFSGNAADLTGTLSPDRIADDSLPVVKLDSDDIEELDAEDFTPASTTEVLTGTDSAKFATPDTIAALWEQGSNIASAGTISIGEGGYFHITGTTTITDIDPTTDKAGRKFILVFDGILTLTHHSTTLILPTGANITTAAGDTAIFISEGSDAVRCISYNLKSGAALVGGGSVSDAAYGAGWDGDTGAASKNALYDKIETLGAGSSDFGAARLKYYDDFVYLRTDSTGDFATNIASTGTIAVLTQPAIATNTLGVIRGTLGTNAAGRASIVPASFSGLLIGMGTLTFTARMALVNLSDGTNTYTINLGLTDVTGVGPTSCVMFRYTHSVNSGLWQAVTRNAATETATNTTIAPVAGTYQTFKIIVNAAANSITFYIDGTLRATITTNIPLGAGKQMFWALTGLRSAGTSAFNCWDLDFMDIDYLLTTPR